MNVVAKDLAESRMEQVAAGVIAFGCVSEFYVNSCLNLVPCVERAAVNLTFAYELTAVKLLCVKDAENIVAVGDCTLVAYLTAHFRIEGSVFDKHNNGVALVGCCYNLTVLKHCKYLCIGGKACVAHKACLECGNCVHTCFVPAALERLVCTGCFLLNFHKLLELFLVKTHFLFRKDFLGQVEREAVGIVKLEYVLAGKNIALFHC